MHAKRLPRVGSSKKDPVPFPEGQKRKTPCAKAGSSKRHPVQRHIPSIPKYGSAPPPRSAMLQHQIIGTSTPQNPVWVAAINQIARGLFIGIHQMALIRYEVYVAHTQYKQRSYMCILGLLTTIKRVPELRGPALVCLSAIDLSAIDKKSALYFQNITVYWSSSWARSLNVQDIIKERTKETNSNKSSTCISPITIAGAGQHSFNTCLRCTSYRGCM